MAGRPRKLNEDQVAAAVELLGLGNSQADVARLLDVHRSLVARLAREKGVPPLRGPNASLSEALVKPPPISSGSSDPPISDDGEGSEEAEAAKLIASGNREWLRSTRDNPKAPWSLRGQCAIALARLEREDTTETWSPPEGVAWAEALAAAISEQPRDIRGKVVELLTPEGNDRAVAGGE